MYRPQDGTSLGRRPPPVLPVLDHRVGHVTRRAFEPLTAALRDVPRDWRATRTEMDVRRLPPHGPQELGFRAFLRQVIDLYARAVRRQTANDPVTANVEERIGN